MATIAKIAAMMMLCLSCFGQSHKALLIAPRGGAAALPAFPTNGLVGYWKLDSVSGSTVPDSWDSVNLATNSATFFVSGLVNNAITFTNGGYTDSGHVTYHFGSGGGSGYTFSGWVYNTAATLTNHVVWSYAGFGGLILTVNSGCFVWSHYGSSGWSTATSSAIPSNTWLMVSCRWDHNGTTVPSVTVNGTKTDGAANADVADTSTWHLYIGYDGTSGGSVKGSDLVDELGIWDRSLDDSELTTLYNSGAGRTYP